MNKRKILTITALSVIAALLPSVMILGSQPGPSGHVLESDTTQVEILDMSSLIVNGKIISSNVEITKANDENGQDRAFTVWNVQPDTTYKGKDSTLVSFKTIGGKLSEGLYTGATIDFHVGDQVTVMLVKDPDSIYGDSHHLVSILQGAYTIEDGMSKSVQERYDKTENDLDLIIKNHLN